MAILEKREERQDWLRWAIAFMRRGLWLDPEFEVHGPHDRSERMWGDAWATVDSTDENVPCVFFAKAGRSKYDPTRRSKYNPVNIRVYIGEKGEPVQELDRCSRLKASQLSPRARRWLRGAKRAAEKLRREREDRSKLASGLR